MVGVALRAARLKLDTCGDDGRDLPLEFMAFINTHTDDEDKWMRWCIAPCWGVKSNRHGIAGDILDHTYDDAESAHADAERLNIWAFAKAAIKIHQSILNAARPPSACLTVNTKP